MRAAVRPVSAAAPQPLRATRRTRSRGATRWGEEGRRATLSLLGTAKSAMRLGAGQRAALGAGALGLLAMAIDGLMIHRAPFWHARLNP